MEKMIQLKDNEVNPSAGGRIGGAVKPLVGGAIYSRPSVTGSPLMSGVVAAHAKNMTYLNDPKVQKQKEAIKSGDPVASGDRTVKTTILDIIDGVLHPTVKTDNSISQQTMLFIGGAIVLVFLLFKKG